MKKVRAGVLIVIGLGVLIWLNYAFFTGQFIGLPPEVDVALQSDAEVAVTQLENDSWLVLAPARTAATMGLIMYPEGRMDVRTYAPIGRAIARQGYQVVFLSRRLDRDYEANEETRLEAVMAAYPHITSWAVGGHTWGGQIAAAYATDHPERVAGLVLWAGRIDETAGLKDSQLPVLMVYGTLDESNVNLLAASKPGLPEHTEWVEISGGNRVQFGNYGPMAADVGATIDNETQQTQAAAATVAFLNNLSNQPTN